MKICVVVNPHAKRNRRKPDLPAKLERILGPDSLVRLSHTIEDIDNIAREALDANVEVLGISGGDGTLHHTLSRFHHIYGDKPLPLILTLAGGTMNMVCHSIGVLGPSEGIAHRFADQIARGVALRTEERDTMAIGDKLGFIFGLGLVSNFLDAYYAGGTAGPLKAASVVRKGIVSVARRSEFARELFAPWSGKLEIEGKEIPFTKYTAILTQTIENLGIGFRPMYRAFEKKGHFHVIATRMSAVQVVGNIHNIFLGRTMRNPDTVDEVATEMLITPEPTALYTIDGDMYTVTEPFRVGIGPRLKFIIV